MTTNSAHAVALHAVAVANGWTMDTDEHYPNRPTFDRGNARVVVWLAANGRVNRAHRTDDMHDTTTPRRDDEMVQARDRGKLDTVAAWLSVPVPVDAPTADETTPDAVHGAVVSVHTDVRTFADEDVTDMYGESSRLLVHRLDDDAARVYRVRVDVDEYADNSPLDDDSPWTIVVRRDRHTDVDTDGPYPAPGVTDAADYTHARRQYFDRYDEQLAAEMLRLYAALHGDVLVGVDVDHRGVLTADTDTPNTGALVGHDPFSRIHGRHEGYAVISRARIAHEWPTATTRPAIGWHRADTLDADGNVIVTPLRRAFDYLDAVLQSYESWATGDVYRYDVGVAVLESDDIEPADVLSDDETEWLTVPRRVRDLTDAEIADHFDGGNGYGAEFDDVASCGGYIGDHRESGIVDAIRDELDADAARRPQRVTTYADGYVTVATEYVAPGRFVVDGHEIFATDADDARTIAANLYGYTPESVTPGA